VSHRKKSNLTIQLEYSAVRLLIGVIRILPWRRALGLARLIGSAFYLVDSRHRKRAMGNLSLAFPDWSEKQLQGVTKEVFMRLVESAVEVLNALRFIRSENMNEYFVSEGMEEADKVAATGKGIVFVTGHFGNWEILGAMSSLYGYPLWSLARPLDNLLLNDLVTEFRETAGQRVLDRRSGLRHAIRLLREGSYVAFLIDQDARGKGIYVPFFGRPASTASSFARIAIQTGCPIFLGYALRKGDSLVFEVKLRGPLWPDSEADKDEEVYRLTSTVTRWLEEAIRENPAHWLWLHRRWKTQPKQITHSSIQGEHE